MPIGPMGLFTLQQTGATVAKEAGVPAWATIAATGGLAGIPYLFGKKKPTEQQDFIADIRRRLEGLAAEVPPLVERRKQLLREQFGVAEARGLQDIAGEFRAERGFGELSTPEVRRRAMLRETLTRGLAGEELRAEEWGLQRRAGFTEALGGIRIPEEEAGFGEELLGFGGELLGEELRTRRLRDIFRETEEERFGEEIGEIPTVVRGG